MKYPIGIQSFSQIREDGYVYVDKTALIYDLVTTGKIYFLSRPRRFGKSLLVSTLENYFLGRKELFRGLAIDSLEKEWNTYPVFHIDFNGKDFNEPNELKSTLDTFVANCEDKYGKNVNAQTYGDRLLHVFKQAHEQTGRRAVVLIDGYDRPLIDVMNKDIPAPAINGDIRTAFDYNLGTLSGFYSIFKLVDDHTHFVLLTGETTFAQNIVFSGFNQHMNISYDARYEALCGITKDEMLNVFKQQIKELGIKNGMTEPEAIDMLTRKYDGYHFSEDMTDMFNPFSLLNCLDMKDFQDYWFSTGTPEYLMRLMSDNNVNINELAGKEYIPAEFVDYKASKQKPLPMLYQSGYLTIKGYDREFNVYRLDFPNEEVRTGMLSLLASDYFAPEDSSSSWITDVTRTLRAGDLDTFRLQLTSMLSNISYRFQRKQDEKECERHFQYTFYLIMQLLGKYNTYVEKETSQGRIDCVLECPGYVYIFEFKLNGTASAALQQIDDKGYALPYAADRRKLYKVGISFSSETGTISEFEYQ